MSAAPKVVASVDPTVYPVSDNMGENSLELFIRVVLLPLLEDYLIERGTPMLVGGNQFVYYRQYDPKLGCVAPDVYVVPGLPPQSEFGCLKTWEAPGQTPTFAMEIVSLDKRKDYDQGPERYAELGVRELVIYDPSWRKRRSPTGLRWQVYRRIRGRGFVRVEATNEDRVRSKELGCYLRAVRQGTGLRLRLGVGPAGDMLFPTATERALAEAERQQAEAERQQAEAERQQAEAAKARHDADEVREDARRAQAEVERQRTDAEKARRERDDLRRRVQELEAKLPTAR